MSLSTRRDGFYPLVVREVACGIGAVVAIMAVLIVPANAVDARPVVAIVAHNAGTETTDFLVPYGVLAMSEAVDLHPVSTDAGPVALHPALNIELPETIDTFDAAHPAGARFVIVPAVHEPSNPRLIAWLASQAKHGATLVAICDGIWPVAATGVLEGRRATAHWYSLDDLQAKYPNTTWVRDRRYVHDGPVMTTTGVTASIPASLALIEELAGHAPAEAIAERLGVQQWNAEHDSRQFSLTTRDMATAARNWLAFWNYERVGISVAPDTDEIALALMADALARTYRTSVFALSSSADAVRLKHGMTLLPDVADAVRVDRVETLPSSDPPVRVLDNTLDAIERVHGPATADFVALQIEYPQRRLRVADTSLRRAGGAGAD